MSSDSKSIATTENPTLTLGLFKRGLLALLGLICVLVAYVGVLLPGIPTIGPLLLASFFFTKSCPYLEKKLVRNRFFAKVLPYLDGKAEMPLNLKLASIAVMWLSIGLSCWLVMYSQIGGYWLPSLLTGLGVVGTFFIWRFGKQKRLH